MALGRSEGDEQLQSRVHIGIWRLLEQPEGEIGALAGFELGELPSSRLAAVTSCAAGAEFKVGSAPIGAVAGFESAADPAG